MVGTSFKREGGCIVSERGRFDCCWAVYSCATLTAVIPPTVSDDGVPIIKEESRDGNESSPAVSSIIKRFKLHLNYLSGL